MSRELIVIGAGGGSRELLEFIADINASLSPEQHWQVSGVLDDDVTRAGGLVAGVRVVGTLADVQRYPGVQIVIGIANQHRIDVRRVVFERLGLPEQRYATLIHPRAYVAARAQVGPGCVLYPHVCVGPNAIIGRNTVVYFNTVIHHGAEVGPHSAVCSGVCLAGHASVGECVYVGAAAAIRDGVRVGDETLVGMGAVVVKDIPGGQTICGVPARSLRRSADHVWGPLPAGTTPDTAPIDWAELER